MCIRDRYNIIASVFNPNYSNPHKKEAPTLLSECFRFSYREVHIVAVSYTHLDVYKRQIYDNGGSLLAWATDEELTDTKLRYQFDKSKPFRSHHAQQIKLKMCIRDREYTADNMDALMLRRYENKKLLRAGKHPKGSPKRDRKSVV